MGEATRSLLHRGNRVAHHTRPLTGHSPQRFLTFPCPARNRSSHAPTVEDMDTRTFARAGAVVAAVVAGSMALAGPVMAYPPGTDPVVTTAAGGFVTGQSFPVTIVNLTPDCPVTVTVAKNGSAVGSYSTTSGASGGAATTIPGLTDAGSYTITVHGDATPTHPDCATPGVSTTVVVASNAPNPGNSSTPKPVTPEASGTGFMASIGDFMSSIGTYFADNPRSRNLLLIVLVIAAGFLFFFGWRRRHDDDEAAVTATMDAPTDKGPEPPST